MQDARAKKPADKPLTAADVYGRAGLLAFDRRAARAAWRGSRGRRPTCASRMRDAGETREMLRAFSDAQPALLNARFTDEAGPSATSTSSNTAGTELRQGAARRESTGGEHPGVR